MVAERVPSVFSRAAVCRKSALRQLTFELRLSEGLGPARHHAARRSVFTVATWQAPSVRVHEASV